MIIPSALRIVLTYAAFAALWILLSDTGLTALFGDPAANSLAGAVRNWGFVVLSSLLLYLLLRRHSRHNAPPSPTRANSPRTLPLVVPLAIAILTGLAMAQTLVQQKEKEVARLQAIANLKSGQISNWLAERHGDAELIGTSSLYAEQFRRWKISGDSASGELFRTRLEDFRQRRGFAHVMVLDSAGRYLWGSANTSPVLSAELQSAAQQAGREGRPHRGNPVLDSNGRTYLDFVIPLTATSGPVPLVVLRADLEDWLFPTLRTWPTPSASAETILFRRDGDEVQFLNELRHKRNPNAKLRFPITSEELLAAKLLRGEARSGEAIVARDYRDTPVMGVVHPIEGTDWLMVAKIDRLELYQDGMQNAAWIGLAGVLGLFASGVSMVMLRQRQDLALADSNRQAQEDRLRALNLIGTIADGSDDAIFAKDREGHYLLFNKAAERFTGKRAEEALGRDDTHLFPPEQAALLMVNDAQVMADKRTVRFQERVTTPGGELIFMATKGPLFDPDGTLVGTFGISRDISEHEKATEALRTSESRFRALVEQTLAGIYIIQDGLLRYVNPGFAEIFAYDTPGELIDRVPVASLISPEDRQQVADNIRQRMEGKIPEIHYTCNAVRRDGKSITLEIFGRSLSYQGRPAVIGLLLDITAQKMAEDALRASEKRFYDVAMASSDWIWEVDAQWRYTYVSEGVTKLLGYQSKEILGKTPFDFMPHDEARRARVVLENFAARNLPIRDFDNVNVCKDGSLCYVKTNGTPISDDTGSFSGYRGLDRDVTDMKYSEIFLQQQAEDINRRNVELERFNRAMVGREMDMVELKKIINALSQQLGQEPPYRLAALDSTDAAPPEGDA